MRYGLDSQGIDKTKSTNNYDKKIQRHRFNDWTMSIEHIRKDVYRNETQLYTIRYKLTSYMIFVLKKNLTFCSKISGSNWTFAELLPGKLLEI